MCWVMENLVSKVNRWISLEDEQAGILIKKSLRAKDAVMKLAFRQLAFETVEHVDIMETIKALATGQVKPSTPDEITKKDLEGHIKAELESLKEYEEMAAKVEGNIKILLLKLVADEKRHHEILKNLLEKISG